MIFGAHESVAGGLHNAISRGREHGCDAIQVFARPSAQWQAKPFLPEDVSLFRSEHALVGWPLLSHTSYLINICATDPVILRKSRTALVEEMLRAEELGIDYVVLHPGAHLGGGEDGGVTAAAATLSYVHELTRGIRAKLLLEITAGQGTCLGCRFEHMEQLLMQTRGGDAMGVCFDTCHAHAAGYDLSTEEGYDATMAEFDRVLGLDRLVAFHLNDSKTPTGSHVDRHAELGDGYLGLLPFWRLVNDPRFERHPAILETPSGLDKLPSFTRNLERLRALVGAARPEGPPRPQILPPRASARAVRANARM